MSDKIIVTCMQERWDNATMIVRVNGKVLGRLVQDSAHKWLVYPPEPPTISVYPSLTAAVDALVSAELTESSQI
jgi:hypothetical protein